MERGRENRKRIKRGEGNKKEVRIGMERKGRVDGDSSGKSLVAQKPKLYLYPCH